MLNAVIGCFVDLHGGKENGGAPHGIYDRTVSVVLIPTHPESRLLSVQVINAFIMIRCE